MAIFAIQYPVFQPAMRIIDSITQSNPCVITTTFPHQFQTGLIVRLKIPKGFGMLPLNNKQGFITVINTTQFSLDIDTTYFDPFIAPVTYPLDAQQAQVVPIGTGNAYWRLATQNVLPYSS